MKLIVFGGRDFYDYKIAKERLDFFLQNVTEEIEIVSGRCDCGSFTFLTKDGIKVYGADGIGELYAEERCYPVTAFPAHWKAYGKRAGPLRNMQMANYGTHAIGFWDGKSKGTLSMIEICKRNNIPLKVVMYNENK